MAENFVNKFAENISLFGEGFIHNKLHHQLMKLLLDCIHLAVEYISILGALLLILSVAVSVLNVLLSFCNNSILKTKFRMVFAFGHEQNKTATLARARVQLGGLAALGLEVLVIADVLETLTKPIHEFSYDVLGKIGCVAAFRTVLAYFLGKETKELSLEIEEEENEQKKEKKHAKKE